MWIENQKRNVSQVKQFNELRFCKNAQCNTVGFVPSKCDQQETLMGAVNLQGVKSFRFI